MKKYYKKESVRIYITSIMMLLYFTGYSETQSNVFTPKGSPVIAYIYEELSESFRAYTDNDKAINYPNANQIETYDSFSSTGRFNCHSYAWYMSQIPNELAYPRWIGKYTYEEDIYMSDGSYVRVANEMYPGKVSWPTASNHSANTTSQSGIFKSKWGSGPLMVHDWDDQPYGLTDLKYYVSTDISGSNSELCNNSTKNFSARIIPNAEYDWSVGPGLTLNSDGNYNTSVTANSSYNGETWIEVEISSPLGGGLYDEKTSKKFTFWVGRPDTPTTNPRGFPTIQLSEFQLLTVRLFETPGYYGGDINWWCNGSIEINSSSTGRICVFEATDTGIGNFYVTTQNTCGTSPTGGGTVNVTSGGGGDPLGPMLLVFPNPAAESFEIQLDESIATSDENEIESELRIYDQYNNLKEIRKFRGKKYKIYTNRLTKGLYLIEVVNKNGKFTTKVIVNKK